MLQSNTFGFGRFYSNLETWDILVKQGIPGSVSSAYYMYHAAIFLQVLAPLYSEMHRPLSQSLEIILLFGVKFCPPPAPILFLPTPYILLIILQIFTSSNKRPEILQITSAFLLTTYFPRSNEAQGHSKLPD